MTIRWFASLCAFTIGLVLLGSSAIAQERNLNVQSKTGTGRFALVIGNDSYTHVRPLDNARADARAMAQALQQAGFDVSLRLDLGERAMREAVRNFKARLSGGNEAAIYFAGHGVQLGAANYLLPVDITADNEEQVRDDGLPLQRILDDLAEQKVRFSLVIVDACRDNPFPRVAGRSIGTGRGLAPTSAATGQMVIYSAGTGQTALDRLNAGDGNPNGLFTRVFLKEMQKPGVPVDRVLRNVRDQVVAMARSVGHEQVPALYDQAIGEFYFLTPSEGMQAVSLAPPSSPLPTESAVNDRAFWDSIKDSRRPEEFNAYLQRFPEGLFVPLARTRLSAIGPVTARDEAPKATIYLMRKGGFLPSGHVVRIYNGNDEVGDLADGSYIAYPVESGPRTLYAMPWAQGAPPKVPLTLRVESGKDYYLLVEEHWGLGSPLTWELVGERDGKELVSNLKWRGGPVPEGLQSQTVAQPRPGK